MIKLMKKVLTIIAALTLLACSKTEPVYDQQDEIIISPISENTTKAMMPKGEFLGESFNVWAWHNPTSALADAVAKFQSGFADGNTTLYVDEKPFVEKDAAKNLWGGKVSYYWPNTGSLLFAGYHAPGLADDQVTYTFNATDNKMVFTDVKQSAVTAEGYADDIMYFNMTPSSYNKITNEVNLKFRHALSWITVTLAKRADPVIEAEITIEDVTFTSVSEQGTGTVDKFAPISWVASNPKDLKHPGLPMVIEYDMIDGKEATKIYKLQEHLFIPQQIAGLLVVTYTVKSADEDGSKFTEIYKVDLRSLKEGAHNTWDAGKHYTYNLSIGTDEILVTPSVEPWENVGTDILIPLPEDMYDNTQNN